MKPYKASALHAILLVGMGLWGYYDSGSNTALIPVVMGVILISLLSGVKKENKVIAHIAVVVTLLAILGMGKPFMGQLEKSDMMGIVRTGLMLVSGICAMFTFIQSFIAARKAKG